MHCHCCVNHFPQHIAVCLEPTPCLPSSTTALICYLWLLHSSVGAASSQLWALPGWTWRQQLLELLRWWWERTASVWQTRPGWVHVLQSTKPSIITLLRRALAPKRIFTELQDEQLLSLSFTVFSLFCPLSSRGRNNINTQLPSQLPERRLQSRVPSHTSLPTAPVLPRQCISCVRNSHFFLTAFAQNLPATEMPALGCWDMSCAAAEAPQSQQSHQGTGHSLSWANTILCLQSLAPQAHSGMLLVSQVQRSWALLSVLHKLLCVTRAFPHREQRAFGHLQALLLEEPEDQSEQISQ